MSAHLWRTSVFPGLQNIMPLHDEDLAVDFHFRNPEFLLVVPVSSWACLPLRSSKHDSDIS